MIIAGASSTIATGASIGVSIIGAASTVVLGLLQLG